MYYIYSRMDLIESGETAHSYPKFLRWEAVWPVRGVVMKAT